MWRPHASREHEKNEAQQAEKSQTSPSLSLLSEIGRNNSDDGRDNDDQVDSSTGEALLSSPAPAQDDHSSDQDPVLHSTAKQGSQQK